MLRSKRHPGLHFAAPPDAQARVVQYVMQRYSVMLPQACSIIDSMDLDERGGLYESLLDEEVEYVLLA